MEVFFEQFIIGHLCKTNNSIQGNIVLLIISTTVPPKNIVWIILHVKHNLCIVINAVKLSTFDKKRVFVATCIVQNKHSIPLGQFSTWKKYIY